MVAVDLSYVSAKVKAGPAKGAMGGAFVYSGAGPRSAADAVAAKPALRPTAVRDATARRRMCNPFLSAETKPSLPSSAQCGGNVTPFGHNSQTDSTVCTGCLWNPSLPTGNSLARRCTLHPWPMRKAQEYTHTENTWARALQNRTSFRGPIAGRSSRADIEMGQASRCDSSLGGNPPTCGTWSDSTNEK
jgi:hypothetical protein